MRLIPLKWLVPVMAASGVIFFAAGFYAGSLSRPASADIPLQALRETESLVARVSVDWSRVEEGSLNATAVTGLAGQAKQAYARASSTVTLADPGTHRRIEEGLARLEEAVSQRAELRRILDLADGLRADLRAAATRLGGP